MHITRKEGNIYLCTSKGAATTPPYFDPLPSPASAYPIPKFLCILRSSRHSLREREREGEFPIFKPNVVSLPAQTSRGIPRSTHTHTHGGHVPPASAVPIIEPYAIPVYTTNVHLSDTSPFRNPVRKAPRRLFSGSRRSLYPDKVLEVLVSGGYISFRSVNERTSERTRERENEQT